MLTFPSLNNIYKENCGSAMGYTPVVRFAIEPTGRYDRTRGQIF